jgi:hypothetical protein
MHVKVEAEIIDLQYLKAMKSANLESLLATNRLTDGYELTGFRNR